MSTHEEFGRTTDQQVRQVLVKMGHKLVSPLDDTAEHVPLSAAQCAPAPAVPVCCGCSETKAQDESVQLRGCGHVLCLLCMPDCPACEAKRTQDAPREAA